MVDFAASFAWQYPGPCKSCVKQVIEISSAYQSSTCLHVQTPAVFQQYGRVVNFTQLYIWIAARGSYPEEGL